MPRDYLGELEQVILLALLQLRTGAYGVTIRDEILARTGRAVSLGSIYPTLKRLEAKGLVRSHTGDPTPERGGRAKRFFALEPAGMEALHQTRRMLDALWRGADAAPGEVDST